MVRTRAVVTERLRGMGAEEDGPGMADTIDPVLRVRHRQLEVFGGEAVDELERLFETTHFDQRAMGGQRASDDPGTFERGKHRLDRRLHPIQKRGIRGDQDRPGLFVVLGLREQIHRDPLHWSIPVADDDDLRRPGEHVDADDAEHEPLCSRHVPVPGPDDLVHRPNRSGSRTRGPQLPAHRLLSTPRPTSARFAAASTSGLSSPDGAGTAMTTSATPATRAGIVFINTVDG